ncbi:MAG: hypothetical protein K0S65_3066, partial [Labilithrix sp.]|nr:hypothetical protein [Labilithrix sp.]
LPLSIDVPQPFRIVVRALDRAGNVDTSFNGFVRISAKPGAIERIESPDAEGRNLRLTNGVAPEVEVKVTNAYGTTFILADDLGYAPTDAFSDPPPACANGIDDDGDGKIDFPADEGCAFANDDTETGGDYSQGASVPIFYRLPRIADVRGLKCLDPNDVNTCSGSGKTPYPKEQILLDTGFHDKPDGSQNFDFDMVVTRISSDGFYVSDIKDERGGFNNVFSFNFNAPPRMRVCDRLKTFAGTATEFFGFTQISYPTWTLEEWDPQKRPCLVPEPHVLQPIDVTPTLLLPLSGGLVRANSLADGSLSVKVTPKFGPGNVPEQGGVFVPSPEASNCDLNKDGRIEFGRLPNGELTPENRCSDACTSDPECTEYSNFAGRSTFRLTLTDGNGNAAAIQADATASAEFKPLEHKGQPLKAFSGTLHFFSGGSQYTIEARCKDDIVVDLNANPLPSDKACVFPRTVLDDNPQ